MDSIEEAYKMFAGIARRKNRGLKEDKPKCEIMVACYCGSRFITFVNRAENDTRAVPVTFDYFDNWECLNCHKNLKHSIVAIGAHSGGIFNAWIERPAGS